MASSDFGFIYDGQMVSAANALHLPVNTMIYMRMHHQWWHDFYNRWWNDMNIIADNSCNQELIGGEVWFGKIAEQLAENYTKPEQRFRTIQKLDGFVQEGLSYKPLDRTKVRTKDLVLDDGQRYDQHWDPFHITAKNILRDLETYETPVGKRIEDLDAPRLHIPEL